MILTATHTPEIQRKWLEATSGVSEISMVVMSLDSLRESLATSPDALILLDLELPGIGENYGLEFTFIHFSNARAIAFSSHCSDEEGEALVRLGIWGYLPITTSVDQVRTAVMHVLGDEMWLSRHLMQQLILRYYQRTSSPEKHHHLGKALAELTPRQQEVAMSLAKGLSNKAIARHLNISERTVKAHLAAIFGRTSVHNRVELAIRIGALPSQMPNF